MFAQIAPMNIPIPNVAIAGGKSNLTSRHILSNIKFPFLLRPNINAERLTRNERVRNAYAIIITET